MSNTPVPKLNIAAASEADLEAMLPKPVGYQLLIAMPKAEETYESGIIKTDVAIRNEEVLANFGLVVDMGEEAYKDTDRYPNGPWCKQGDYVMFRPATGTRMVINDVEYRLMNDDSIQATVANPAGITRL